MFRNTGRLWNSIYPGPFAHGIFYFHFRSYILVCSPPPWVPPIRDNANKTISLGMSIHLRTILMFIRAFFSWGTLIHALRHKSSHPVGSSLVNSTVFWWLNSHQIAAWIPVPQNGASDFESLCGGIIIQEITRKSDSFCTTWQDFDKKLSHVNRGASSTKPVDGAGGAAGLDTMAEACLVGGGSPRIMGEWTCLTSKHQEFTKPTRIEI